MTTVPEYRLDLTSNPLHCSSSRNTRRNCDGCIEFRVFDCSLYERVPPLSNRVCGSDFQDATTIVNSICKLETRGSDFQDRFNFQCMNFFI